MNLSELLVMLQYEIQKSYDFVEEITRAQEDEERSVLHVALEKVEIELPITLKETSTTFDPRKVERLPISVKRLAVPYKPEMITKKGAIPENRYTGKTASVKLVEPTEKVDKTVTPEKIGRIKVSLKPILK